VNTLIIRHIPESDPPRFQVEREDHKAAPFMAGHANQVFAALKSNASWEKVELDHFP